MNNVIPFRLRNQDPSPTARVRAAAAHAGDYFDACCRMRSARAGGTGSTYRLPPDRLKTMFLAMMWEPYDHPAIEKPAVAFKATFFGGCFGMIRLDELASGCEIELVDPKGTGFVEGVVRNWPGRKPTVDFTVAILGPHPKDGRETLYTFHPGDPVPPSRIEAQLEGQILTPSQARKLGLEWVKLT
jgi:hypothetical protein